MKVKLYEKFVELYYLHISLRLPDDRMEGIWYDCDTDEEGDEKNDACWEDLLDVLKDNIVLTQRTKKTIAMIFTILHLLLVALPTPSLCCRDSDRPT